MDINLRPLTPDEQKYAFTQSRQINMQQRVRHLRKVVAEEQQHEMNADGFLQLVRKYTDIRELSHEMVHEFIDKIVVYHREERFGEMVQKVEIYYKMVGYLELPQMSKAEKQSYAASFGRKEEGRSA